MKPSKIIKYLVTFRSSPWEVMYKFQSYENLNPFLVLGTVLGTGVAKSVVVLVLKEFATLLEP